MTAVITGHWPAFAIAAGALLLLISALGFARASHPRWHRAHRAPSRHAAVSDEDRQTIAWLARIRPRPLADARIRVAALTAVIQTAAQPLGGHWPVDRDREGSADLDQFLPQTLPPLPDLHPGWPGHADGVPAAFIRPMREISDEEAAELTERWRERWREASTRPRKLMVLPDNGDISEEEHQAAVTDLIARYGEVPPSLQRVIDQGGRIAQLPAAGEPEPAPEVQPHPADAVTTAWLSQAPDPAQAGHLQPLWADDTGSFAAICAGDAV